MNKPAEGRSSPPTPLTLPARDGSVPAADRFRWERQNDSSAPCRATGRPAERRAHGEPVFMTYREVSSAFGIPVPTLYSMVCRKEIPHYRLGPRFVRFDRQALEAWFAARHVPASGERTQHTAGNQSAAD